MAQPGVVIAPPVADNDEELFELVDDEDNVIGTENRSICHNRGLLHRAGSESVELLDIVGHAPVGLLA